MTRRRLVVLAAILALLAIVYVDRYTLRDWQVKRFSIRGIDLSHHQKDVDWDKLKEAGQRFAYLKATEGGDHKDTQFKRNWAEARRVGIPRGAYHFFTFCKPGAEQAKNFIETVPVEADALPPVIDFEFVGNCKERPPKEKLLKELEDFNQALKKRYGKQPMLYLTWEAHLRYLQGEAHRYPIWARNTYFKPGPVDGRGWTLWQYTDEASVPGTPGPVDQNVFSGGEEEFARFLGR